jgi:hypothetical protein
MMRYAHSLLKNPKEWRYYGSCGSNLLHHASQKGSVFGVWFAVNYLHLPLDSRDMFNKDVLGYAAEGGSLRVIVLLLLIANEREQKLNPTAIYKTGSNAFGQACKGPNNLNIRRLLGAYCLGDLTCFQLFDREAKGEELLDIVYKADSSAIIRKLPDCP